MKAEEVSSSQAKWIVYDSWPEIKDIDFLIFFLCASCILLKENLLHFNLTNLKTQFYKLKWSLIIFVQ